ncbi:hypothetical protein H8959_006586 [Pygathrix nigripes]
MESNLSLRVEMRGVGHGTGTRPESADPIECCLSDTGPFPPSKGCHGMQGPLWPWGLGDNLEPFASPRLPSHPFPRFISAFRIKKKKKKKSRKHQRMRPNHHSGIGARSRPADSRELTGTHARAHTLRRPARQLVTPRRLVPALLAAFDQRALAGVDGHALPCARGRSALELADPGNSIETRVIMATLPYLIGYLLHARGRPADSRELTGTYLRAHTLRRPARQRVTSRRLVPALLAAFDQCALDVVDGHALPSARGRSALELTDPGNPIETPVIMATVPYLIGYLLQFVGSTTLIGYLASQGLYKLDAWKFGSSLPFSYFSLSGISSSSTGDVEMESDLSRCGGATVQAYWLPGDEFIAPAKRDEVLKGFGPIPGKMVRGGGGGVSKRRRRAQESAQTGPNDWPGVSPRSELDQSESCS